MFCIPCICYPLLCVCLFVEYDNVLWFLVVFVRSFIQIYFLFVHLSFSRCSSVSCVLCVRTFPQSITLALSKWNELEKWKCLPHSDGCYLIFLFRCSPFVAINGKFLRYWIENCHLNLDTCTQSNTLCVELHAKLYAENRANFTCKLHYS